MTLFGVRIFMPVFITAILVILEILLFHKDAGLLCSILFSYVSLSVAVSLSPTVEKIRKEQQFIRKKGVSYAACMINTIVSIFHIYAGGIGIIKTAEITIEAIVCIGISLLLQLLLNGFLMWRNIPVMLEVATDYEICVRIRKVAEKAQ